MYNSLNISENIKAIAKLKQVSVKSMLSDLELGVNTLQNMKTSMPKSDTLARIADYLGCSVDYLLGRTSEQTSEHNITAGNIENSRIDNSTVTTAKNLDSTTKQFLDTFEELSLESKIKVISYAIELKNKE